MYVEKRERRGGQVECAGQTDADFRDARLFVDEEVLLCNDEHEATPNFSTAPLTHTKGLKDCPQTQRSARPSPKSLYWLFCVLANPSFASPKGLYGKGRRLLVDMIIATVLL